MDYKCVIKFTSDYLYDAYTDEAKRELVNSTSKGIQDVDIETAKLQLYKDNKGLFIPNVQLFGCFKNAGMKTKWKKSKSNWKKWVESYLSVTPTNIYVDKKEPDNYLTSYPKRKDGSRVKKIHPVLNAGLQIEFNTEISDPEKEYSDRDIQNLVEKAGSMFGIGGRRPDKFGRFKIVSFDKV